ncbi:MAG: metallophosphoesterase [Deltaproteobacteria bacterium]|nr:MAG: metallophosphoesterase [Deltaproteobacteria bacterium]RLC19050.1 MAG: metallophosphoesterase [Deltaproteobacteria bacterium]HGY11807.1 metallophosphoesterase [Desulfobacterales bacterium]
MKRILIVGDIHANYPALKAIQSHVQAYRFDRIINTGDTIVYNTFPNETIQWFRKRKKSVSISGNTDRRILKILKGKKLKKPGKEEKRVMYFWTIENLLPENVNYLQLLPRQADLTIDNVRIGVFHGTLDDKNETLFPDSPENRFRKLAERSPYQIQIMGHSHTPYCKTTNGVCFINPGSAGRMFDGDPRASFAILKISLGKINVEHFRIPYPVEEVIKGLKKNHLPGIYKEMFRTGKKLN